MLSTRFLKAFIGLMTIATIGSVIETWVSVLNAQPDYAKGTFCLLLACISVRLGIAALDSLEIRTSNEARLAARYGKVDIERVS